MTDAPATLEAPWPVGLLSAKLRDYIDRLGSVWVEGEITQWGASAGNVYGKLKDLERDATVSFTVWSSVRRRIPDDLKQGDHVVALVKPNFWVKGGTLTMQVLDVKHVGLGELLERLERLRRTLAAEGLFDPSRKRPLPFLPRLVGLVTGRDSDAEKDVVRNARLRWPQVAFRTVYAAVQGERTVPEVVAAIRALDEDPEVDVIVVARGGGDFQNLLGFSDERVVRAAAECTTPLVSAIGHEADRPLLDEVADLRASTPTDAAKRVVPDVSEELARVEQARLRLSVRINGMLAAELDRLGQLRSRPVLAGSGWIVDSRAEEVTRVVARGVELIERRLERADHEVEVLARRLHALSPASTLDRGYAIVQTAAGHVARRARDLPAGSPLTVTLAEGAVRATSDGEIDDARSRSGGEEAGSRGRREAVSADRRSASDASSRVGRGS